MFTAIFASKAYLFKCIWIYLFRLDLVMNSTTFPKCFSPLQIKSVDANNKSYLFPVIGAVLIPFIITVNLLLIFGIIKTKRNTFTSSQILFLTLFVSDLTIGMVQLPMQTYSFMISHDPTCFEILLDTFFTTFTLSMSGTLLCVISLDRYIYVVHNNYYKTIVTKWSLTITIFGVILNSIIWATLHVFFQSKTRDNKSSKMLFCSVSLYGDSANDRCCFVCSFTNKGKTNNKKLIYTTKNRFTFNKDNSSNCSYPGDGLFAIDDLIKYFRKWTS